MHWSAWLGIAIAVVILIAITPVLRMYSKPAVRLAAAEPSDPATPGGANAVTTVHDFSLTANDGSAYPLSALAGQPVLLVNTASRCGLTGQYAGLQALYERFAERGLVVVGVPANDFMRQEPGTNEEIAKFCDLRFGVTFPLMAKSVVNGDGQHPLYTWLTTDSPLPGPISWNFEKFLINGDGQVVARFAPRTAPDDQRVIDAIEGVLPAADAAADGS